MKNSQVEQDSYTEICLKDMHSLNDAIYHAFCAMNPVDYEKQSHLFNGRYENIYIAAEKIPPLGELIELIRTQAAEYLQLNPLQLKMGFWFNVMKPGDSTTRHCHDDLDELLSGVYYIRVPKQSGKLVLYAHELRQITPEEGMLLFFSPALEHEVLKNESSTIRLSIGFNACQQEIPPQTNTG